MAADDLQHALGESKRAAKDLAVASARLTKQLLKKAEAATKDPSGSASRAAKKVAEELDAAAKEIERILKDL
jgi:signal transduction histidine kinase